MINTSPTTTTSVSSHGSFAEEDIIMEVPLQTTSDPVISHQTHTARIEIRDGEPKYIKSDNDDSSSFEKYEFTCPVCNLNEKPLTIVICGHSICEECSKHLTTPNCPICRGFFYRWMLIENKYITEKGKNGTQYQRRNNLEKDKEWIAKLDDLTKKRKLQQADLANNYINEASDQILSLFQEGLKKDVITKSKFYFTLDTSSRFYTRLADKIASNLESRLESYGVQVRSERTYYSDLANRGLSYTISINTVKDEF